MCFRPGSQNSAAARNLSYSASVPAAIKPSPASLARRSNDAFATSVTVWPRRFNSQPTATWGRTAPMLPAMEMTTFTSVAPAASRSVRAPPERSLHVDRDNGIVNPAGGAEIVDRLLAGRNHAVVVDDHISAPRHPVVQIREGIHRRFVQISVEPQDRQLLDRRIRQRVAEPSLKEPDLLVEQLVALEIVPHVLQGDGELPVLLEMNARVERILAGVGRRQPFE